MALEQSRMLAILRWNLINEKAVFNIVQGNVFDHHGEDVSKATAESPVLIVETRGGSRLQSAPVAGRSIHLYAYSNLDSAGAHRLYEAATEVLNRQGIKAQPDENGDPCWPQCLYCYESDGVLSGYNNEVRAWFVRGTWAVWQKG